MTPSLRETLSMVIIWRLAELLRATSHSQQKQLVTLVENAEEELQGVILIGLYSGMRLDEIASLKRDDIVEIDGIRVFSVTKSKTKAGIRCVPIHSMVLPIVERWLSLKIW